MYNKLEDGSIQLINEDVPFKTKSLACKELKMSAKKRRPPSLRREERGPEEFAYTIPTPSEASDAVWCFGSGLGIGVLKNIIYITYIYIYIYFLYSTRGVGGLTCLFFVFILIKNWNLNSYTNSNLTSSCIPLGTYPRLCPPLHPPTPSPLSLSSRG